jgi:hypothetical protein
VLFRSLDAQSGACVATTLAGYGTLSVLKRENLA